MLDEFDGIVVLNSEGFFITGLVREDVVENTDPSAGGESSKWVSRRNVLRGVGIGSTAALAGCSGGSENNVGGGTQTSGVDGEAAGEGTTETGAQTGSASSEGLHMPAVEGSVMDFHMNGAWGPANYITHGSRFGRIIFDPIVEFMGNTSSVVPVHASDYTKEGTNLTISLREQSWHNGDPYTVESIALFYDIEFMIAEHTGETRGSTQYIEDYTIQDDLTIDFTLTQDWNPGFVLSSQFDGQMYPFHPDVWTEWRDRLEEAGPGSDEFDTVLSELSTFTDVRVGGEPFVGYGPWQFEERNASRLVLSKYPEHPNAGDINFDTIQFNAVSEPFPAWAEGRTDVLKSGLPLSPERQQQAPPREEYQLFAQDNLDMLLAVMNSEAETDRPTGQREIRHSLGFALNYEDIATNLGEPWRQKDWPSTNLSQADIERGFFDVSDFTHHGNDPARAKELINQADGYAYENDQVVNSDGSQVSLSIMTGNFPDRVTYARTIANQLSQFGWDATVDAVDDPTYVDRRSKGEFDIQIDPTGVGSSMYMWAQSRIMGYYMEQLHYPPEWEVPMPIGEPNLSPDEGELTTFDLADLTSQIETAQGLEGAHDVLYKLGWGWNQFLPTLAGAYRTQAGAVRSPPFEIVTEERTLRETPSAFWHLLRTGLLKAVE